MNSIGPLTIDIAGLSLTEEDRRLITHPLIGGIILFARNYESPEQLIDLVRSIRAIKPNLLISVDQEGGRVQRFKTGFTRLPAMGKLGEKYDQHPEQACQLAQSVGWLMAIEVAAVGVDFSFAPVLDLNWGVSKVIGDRAFHGDSSSVIDLATAWIEGMRSAGMAAVGKHFPGHGAVSADSHVDMPRDQRSFSEIEVHDLLPFQRLIEAKIGAIMPAHVVFEQVDPLPVGFSSHWLQHVLRGQLNFQGAIFSDDLTMEGASIVGDMVERAKFSLEAGCDMLLICNNREAVNEVVENLGDRAIVPKKCLQNMQIKKAVSWADMKKDLKWMEISDRILQEFGE